MLSTPKGKGGLFLASSLCDGLEDNDIKQVTTLLLNNEADPNVLIPSHGVTPFHLVIGNDSEAFAEEVTKLFLRHGGNPNVRSSDGLTPVHVAAAWGRVIVLELLLANGGDPLCVDDDGRNPFHYAFDGKYYKAITVLGKYCEENRDDDKDVKFTMAFDKLVLKNADVVAEYAASEASQTDDLPTLNESDPKFKQEATASSPNTEFSSITINTKPLNTYSSPWLPIRKGNSAVSRHNQAKQDLQEAIEKEKHLVNKIIDQLSTSLKSKQQKNVKNELSETSTSDLNSSYQLSTDENLPPRRFNTEKLSSKTNIKQEFATPTRVRKVLTQNNRKLCSSPRFSDRKASNTSNRAPLTSLYFTDVILSKSPNLKINNEAFAKDRTSQRYQSPMRTTKHETLQKAFTPLISRCNDSNRFGELRHSSKEVTRSTPRRKRFYHHRTPLRKFKNNYSPDTSRDSAASFSPDNESDRRTRDRLFVKLDGNKYDDDEYTDDLDTMNHRLKSLDIISSRDKDANSSIDELRRNFESTYNSSDSQVKHSSGFNSHESFESVNNVPEDEHYTLTMPFKAVDKNFNNLRSNLRPDGLSMGNSTTCSSLASFRSARSVVSVQEDFKYEDAEEGVAFLERRLYTVPSGKLSEDEGLDSDTMHSIRSRPSTLPPDLPAEFETLSNQAIRQRLADLGQNSGPITTTTRSVYLKRLVKLEKLERRVPRSPKVPQQTPRTLNTPISFDANLRHGDWVDELHTYRILEKNTFREFTNPDPTRRWREGVTKTSFNYLLLDPRITNDLPLRAAELTDEQVWHTFLSSIFYIGKGKKSRPYAHLYDAFNSFCNVDTRGKPLNTKIRRILDIWNEGQGVVCLHVFHNVIPVEAYTREAAMIEARGINQLANEVNGVYYGLAATWTIREKFKFGRYLLFRALQILIHDGERQLLPDQL